MQEIGPAPEVLSTEEVIAQCGAKISEVMRQEMSDESDPDRVWILRKIHKNYLYYRGLQYFAPQFFQGLLDATGISGGGSTGDYGNAGLYDYYQNHYRGYCRKLEAVLGNRMPNVIAMPDATDDEQAARATQSANNAALYIRDKCELPMKNLGLVFGLFNFGTMFWHLDWVVDSDKYGFTEEENFEAQQQPLGNASHVCPQCTASVPADPENPEPPAQCPECSAPMSDENYHPPTMADQPVSTGVKSKPKGGLEITLHDASEVSVPLDCTSIDSDDCNWLRWERDSHKARVLQKWEKPDPEGGEATNPLREDASTFDGTGAQGADDTVSSQYAESIRSAMASPIGLVRSKRANRWVECDTWWKPAMYQMIDDKNIRAILKRQYPKGLRICSVRGKILDLREEKLADHWQETKPEPSARIMADPLGDDWVETQDILTNTLNQANETIERSNEPGFGDARYIDFDAYESRRDLPTELIPALKPAGGSLADIIYRPEPNRFSDQIPPFRQGVEESAKNISGLTDPIWGGGDAEEPTARQAELKKNAALMQLGVPWTYIGKSAEKVNMKGCRLLAEFEDGVLSFTKQNQFGGFDSMAVIVEDLRNGKYHFEADEAIPMTWGQMRDLLMWMLDKPAELLEMWGFTDPLNIFEFKQLLGMPGQHTPKLDDRNKMMDVIAQLVEGAAQAGPADPNDPTQAPGPKQASIQPDWEDDHDFAAHLAKAYLQVNWRLKEEKPEGYENVQLWGQAQEKAANQPPPLPPPKTSLALSLKGAVGDPAVQAAMVGSGMIPDGTPVTPNPPVPPALDPNRMPPPGGALPGPAGPIQ